MALIKCPDCQKDVSDKAEKCPFCGCPINPSITNSPSETSAISYSYSKPAPSPKKIALLIVAVFLVTIAIIFGFVLPKQKESSYQQALTLLEKGNYEEGQQLLLKNPHYKDTQNILEEIKFCC